MHGSESVVAVDSEGVACEGDEQELEDGDASHDHQEDGVLGNAGENVQLNNKSSTSS